jgi:hypothetical protein
VKRFALLFCAALAACAPSANPLPGVPAPDRSVPPLALRGGHRHVVFRWDYEEGEITARGDGSVRTAAPDSARLDFFLGGGLGGGTAVLIGDSLRTPHVDLVRRYIPATPLMWAVLGRLAVPALRDTVVHIDGELLRADIGHPVQWRLTARADTLIGLDHISNGRIIETVRREASGAYIFEAPAARRKLRLTPIREEPGSFDASIWSL